MNIGQIKTKTLQIIREYTTDGVVVGTSENADHLMSMNSLINDAQFDLISIRPIIKKYVFDSADDETNILKRYNMPTDFIAFKELKKDDIKFNDFAWENKVLITDSSYEGEYSLWYYAYPTVITETSVDSTELEIDLDLQQIIPYYVAGHSIIDENSSLAEFFISEFNLKKNKIITPSTFKVKTVYSI